MNPGDRDEEKIAGQLCEATKEKYQDERKHFRELFKEYRESAIVIEKEARGCMLRNKRWTRQ